MFLFNFIFSQMLFRSMLLPFLSSYYKILRLMPKEAECCLQLIKSKEPFLHTYFFLAMFYFYYFYFSSTSCDKGECRESGNIFEFDEVVEFRERR